MDAVWLVIRGLHLLAMAFFVGGQLFLAALVVPVERHAPDRERLRAIARRFGYGTLAAIGVLLATGAAMASHYGVWDRSVLQAKLAVLVLVGVLMGLHVASARTRVISLALVTASLVIVWLGVRLASG